MKESNCSICLTPVDAECADILTMGAYGTPKCLCEECSSLIRNVTRGHEYEEICAAMDAVGKRLSDANVDDRRVLETVADIFEGAKERAELIRAGEYDFSLDESETEEESSDLPEELRESDEDRELDAREEEKKKKWDRILNYVSLGIIAAAVALVIWYLVK